MAGETPGVAASAILYGLFQKQALVRSRSGLVAYLPDEPVGNPGKDDFAYVSAALTRDGSLGICYYPGENGKKFHLTVNMSKMGGGAGNSRARWYDPTNGTYQRHRHTGELRLPHLYYSRC